MPESVKPKEWTYDEKKAILNTSDTAFALSEFQGKVNVRAAREIRKGHLMVENGKPSSTMLKIKLKREND